MKIRQKSTYGKRLGNTIPLVRECEPHPGDEIVYYNLRSATTVRNGGYTERNEAYIELPPLSSSSWIQAALVPSELSTGLPVPPCLPVVSWTGFPGSARLTMKTCRHMSEDKV